MSQYFIPTLTTMAQPGEELAKESVNMLVGMILKGEKPRQITLSATLREGDSVISI